MIAVQREAVGPVDCTVRAQRQFARPAVRGDKSLAGEIQAKLNLPGTPRVERTDHQLKIALLDRAPARVQPTEGGRQCVARIKRQLDHRHGVRRRAPILDAAPGCFDGATREQDGATGFRVGRRGGPDSREQSKALGVAPGGSGLRQLQLHIRAQGAPVRRVRLKAQLQLGRRREL